MYTHVYTSTLSIPPIAHTETSESPKPHSNQVSALLAISVLQWCQISRQWPFQAALVLERPAPGDRQMDNEDSKLLLPTVATVLPQVWRAHVCFSFHSIFRFSNSFKNIRERKWVRREKIQFIFMVKPIPNLFIWSFEQLKITEIRCTGMKELGHKRTAFTLAMSVWILLILMQSSKAMLLKWTGWKALNSM